MMISLWEIRKLFQFPTGGSVTLPYIRNRILLDKLQFIRKFVRRFYCAANG